MKNIFAFLALVVLFASCASNNETHQKPNIIYILADDLGYGDLSCYGQTMFETPNIDMLAEGGMKFTDHYSGSTVCAPSRSSLMSGQHTGHTPIRGNKELKGREGQSPMPAATLTVAEVMKKAGYKTGAFGKWGLGFIGSEGDPINQGFDVFVGYNCQRMAHRYYPTHLWKNDEKLELEGNDWTKTQTYAPDVIQEATLQFIEDNKDEPFFAYVPFVLPHAELISPDDSILAQFKGKFEEVPKLVTDSYTSDYGPDCVPSQYCSQKTPFAVFASMVVRMDIYVGQIMEKLEELGIADNTIVMFASDNGPHTEGGANPAYFNSAGGLKGVKRDMYEGGIRTAFIAKWPGKIKAGSRSNHISAFWDVLPTLADIVDVNVDAEVDGISFLPTLLGKGEQEQHPYLYWEINIRGGRVAVRMGNWKGVLYNLNEDANNIELYDLSKDVGEANNVAAEHPEVVAKIKKIMNQAHADSEMFPLGK